MTKLPSPFREFRFDEDRRWKFDFAWPDLGVAVEIEGGLYASQRGKKGRHTTATGFINDCDKYNRAQELGWVVLRYTEKHIRKFPLVMAEQIRSVINARSK